MKQAYEYVMLPDWDGYYRKINVLPSCKKVTNAYGEFDLQLVSRKLFWLIPIKYWLEKSEIKWSTDNVKYYGCNCEEE